jgi:hypothetical protein
MPINVAPVNRASDTSERAELEFLTASAKIRRLRVMKGFKLEVLMWIRPTSRVISLWKDFLVYYTRQKTRSASTEL